MEWIEQNAQTSCSHGENWHTWLRSRNLIFKSKSLIVDKVRPTVQCILEHLFTEPMTCRFFCMCIYLSYGNPSTSSYLSWSLELYIAANNSSGSIASLCWIAIPTWSQTFSTTLKILKGGYRSCSYISSGDASIIVWTIYSVVNFAIQFFTALQRIHDVVVPLSSVELSYFSRSLAKSSLVSDSWILFMSLIRRDWYGVELEGNKCLISLSISASV